MDKSFSTFESNLLYIYTIFYPHRTFVHYPYASRDFSIDSPRNCRSILSSLFSFFLFKRERSASVARCTHGVRERRNIHELIHKTLGNVSYAGSSMHKLQTVSSNHCFACQFYRGVLLPFSFPKPISRSIR